MPTGFQVLLQDEYSDVIDSAFVDPRILGTLRRAQRIASTAGATTLGLGMVEPACASRRAR